MSSARTVATRQRVVAPGEVAAVARMLARAFDDDPYMCFWLPSPRGRQARLRWFFQALLSGLILPAGEAVVTPDLDSAALWAPPGVQGALGAFSKPAGGAQVDAADLARLLRVLLPLGRRAFVGERAGLAAIARAHPRTPHFYLLVVGTEPTRQGRGLGSTVLAPVLERCDAQGLPAYLESSKERNLSLYRRHGFEVTDEVLVGPGGPRLWCMLRPPRSRGLGERP